jgi:hypothetical protein
MTETATATLPDVEVLRTTAQMADFCVKINTKGVSHEESMKQPPEGANCLNWVVGHLVCVYNNTLPLVGQKAVGDKASLQRYDRGSKSLVDPAEAIEFDELLTLWTEATRRIDEGLQRLTPPQLESPAPFSPTNNPKETVRTLLTTLLFHQAYHSGQTGLSRRLVGKAGAIA